MKRNIELKARYPDLDAARRIAGEIGATLHSSERQRDTYFRCRSGRLKLRQRWTDRGESSELIGYERADADRPRASDYSVVPVADAEALRALLAAALGTAGEVDKRRTVYLYQNVRIHLDDVCGLGTFIEFEAVLDGSRSEEECNATLRTLVEAFRIAPGQIVPVSYSDLPGQHRAR
ncbi:MAG TPA: CYTH domain-containing protein [Phycisphaerae bacterium]|nr:CYTH domain-containing protein [Phycisphaerae bacterium]